MPFQKLFDDIYKTDIPYADGYTSVFVLQNEGRFLLLDFAASARDATERILPDLKEAGFVPEMLVCTHRHEDHDGGLARCAEAFSNARVAVGWDGRLPDGRALDRLTEGELLLDRYRVLFLKGHTEDSIGLWDTKSRILLSGDALLGRGIYSADGKPYGIGLANVGAYLETIGKARVLAPSAVVASHAYEPFGCVVRGENVNAFLTDCADTVDRLIAFVRAHRDQTPEAIAARCAAETTLMPPDAWTVKNVLKHVEKQG